MQIKKILAGALGALMTGATIAGVVAAANTVGDYPGFLFSNGNLDAYVVVGENAQAADVVGAVDLAVRLAEFSKTTEMVSCPGSSDDVAVSGGWEFKTGAERLNMNESLTDIRERLTSSQLATVLAGGTYTTSEGVSNSYTEKIILMTTAGLTDMGQLRFQEQSDVDDSPHVLLGWDTTSTDTSDKGMYNYTFSLLPSLTIDEEDDLEDTDIVLQGNAYTITDVTGGGATDLSKLTMMAGSNSGTVTSEAPVTFTIDGTDYEVALSTVGTDANSNTVAIVKVNGVNTKSLQSGETDTVSGITVGVSSIVSGPGRTGGVDTATVYLGAEKIVLEEGSRVQVGESYVDGSLVRIDFTASSTSPKWDGFTINYAPSNDVWLQVGDTWTDPVFGNFKILLGAETASRTHVDLKADGSKKIALKFTNQDGNTLDDDIFYYESDTDIDPGKDADHILYWFESDTVGKRDKFIVESDFYSTIIEFNNYDETDDEITFKDLSSGTTWTEKYTDGEQATATYGSIEFKFTYTESANTMTVDDITDDNDESGSDDADNDAYADLYTTGDYPVKISLYMDAGGARADGSSDNPVTVVFFEGVGHSDVTSYGTLSGWHINETITIDTTNDELDLSTSPTLSAGYSFSSVGDTDVSESMTLWGSKISVDSSGDQNDFNLDAPVDRAYYSVVVGANPSVTASTGEAASTIEQQTVVPITTAVGKLANKVTGSEKNMVLVGGPCANSLVQSLVDSEKLGAEYTCADGLGAAWVAGKAYVHVIDDAFVAGKVAMVVAGTEAVDTRMATSVLQKYDTLLSGKTDAAVEVTAVSSAGIKGI